MIPATASATLAFSKNSEDSLGQAQELQFPAVRVVVFCEECWGQDYMRQSKSSKVSATPCCCPGQDRMGPTSSTDYWLHKHICLIHWTSQDPASQSGQHTSSMSHLAQSTPEQAFRFYISEEQNQH
jgi:hypothetical protein